MKILIFGAAGSGKTTVGKTLSQKMDWLHLDSDDYYWKKTNPPFQEKFPRKERNNAIKRDFESAHDVIVSGSMFSWGDYWKTAFDLAVFLFVPQAVRIERLRKRESERYGDLLKTDPLTIKTSKEFLEWAKTYDDSTSDGQSIVRHQREIESLSCSVLKISGDISVGQKVNLVVKQIASRKPTP